VLEGHPEWQVIEAGDGREAVRLAEVGRPDVVVIDIAISKLNGKGRLFNSWLKVERRRRSAP
jgi:DNA-binding response OmpR family regulator